MALVGLGQVVESDPAASILDGLELLHNLLFGVPSSSDNFPESLKLFVRNRSVVVDVDLTEELHRIDLGKSALPVLNCLLLVNGVRVVQIKAVERLVYFLLAFLSQVLGR